MWKDLMKPVEPVEYKFAPGITTITREELLKVELISVSFNGITIRFGSHSNESIRITRESADELSNMFRCMYRELGEK